MQEYKIIFTETLVHTFSVEAENVEEADNEFTRGLSEGRFDFSDGEVADSEYTITPV